MVTTLIVSQGDLACEILNSVRAIAGGARGMRSLCTDWGESLESTKDRVREAVRQIDDGDGVLVLTDLHGATPTNAALMLADERRIEVVCGVNLPMVVRLACRQGEELDLSATAQWIAGKGSRAITHLRPNNHSVGSEAEA